jgi:hypothetical protein
MTLLPGDWPWILTAPRTGSTITSWLAFCSASKYRVGGRYGRWYCERRSQQAHSASAVQLRHMISLICTQLQADSHRSLLYKVNPADLPLPSVSSVD